MIPQESEIEKSGGRTRVSAEQHLMLGTQTWLEYPLSIQSNKKAEGTWSSPKPGSLSPQRPPGVLRAEDSSLKKSVAVISGSFHDT